MEFWRALVRTYFNGAEYENQVSENKISPNFILHSTTKTIEEKVGHFIEYIRTLN